MSETYHVRVTKDYLVFSAAHFITYGGNICERLHGHNYQVRVKVAGAISGISGAALRMAEEMSGEPPITRDLTLVTFRDSPIRAQLDALRRRPRPPLGAGSLPRNAAALFSASLTSSTVVERLAIKVTSTIEPTATGTRIEIPSNLPLSSV